MRRGPAAYSKDPECTIRAMGARRAKPLCFREIGIGVARATKRLFRTETMAAPHATPGLQ